MSINVGNGFATAYIDQARMHKIRDSLSAPEMTLWEKIKDFFFSTHQREALHCIHKLYHHSSYQMSHREIKETFLKLLDLASPKHKEKFIMTKDNSFYRYKIADEDIVSVRYDDRVTYESKYHAFYDCLESGGSMEHDSFCYYCEDDDVFYDCQIDHADDDTFDVENLRMTSHQQRNRIIPGEIPLSLEGGKARNDALYMQSVRDLYPKIEMAVKKKNKAKLMYQLFGKTLLVKNAIDGIIRNMDVEVNNTQEVKKNIAVLMNTQAVMALIPDSIKSLPEFLLVQDKTRLN